jgi:hypothetical protein
MFANPTIGGRLDSTVVIAVSTATSSEMSAATPSVRTGYAAAISAAVRSTASRSRSTIATDQPSRASRWAVARPMPRGDAAPVTTTVRAAGRVTGHLPSKPTTHDHGKLA